MPFPPPGYAPVRSDKFGSGEGVKDRLYALVLGRTQAGLRHIGDPDLALAGHSHPPPVVLEYD